VSGVAGSTGTATEARRSSLEGKAAEVRTVAASMDAASFVRQRF
jgi:hypothetical protein